MRQEQTPVYAEEDISTDALKGHDVLFLGWPVNPTLRPPLPDGLVVENGGFSFAGKWYANGDAVLFAALPHPSDPLRTTAVFVTQSAAAAVQVVRKIPHYGKYGYLIFTGGEIRTRGGWPVTQSPTFHYFNIREDSR
jgi:hypothetical protein